MAIATIGLAFVAARQLPLLTEQLRLAREAEQRAAIRNVETNTIRACERYTSDVVIYEATKRIWNSSKGGTVYSFPEVNEHDLITVLNYLDGIAVGVKQGVFSKAIVQDHLGATYIKIADLVIPNTFKNFTDYEAIEQLRNSWKVPKPTSYVKST